MEACYLTLGCFGRKDDGFVSCPGVENRILKIDDSLVYVDEIMDYFDSVRLFDRHMLDLNSIRHLLHNLQDRFDQKVKRLWTEKQYGLYERFVVSHKPCGLYVKLILVDEDAAMAQKPEPPKPVLVEGTPIEGNRNLRIVRPKS